MQTSDRDTETRLRNLEVALVETKAELKGDIQALSVKLDERSNSFDKRFDGFDKRLDGLDRKFWAILILLIGQLLALLVALIKLFVGF